MMLGSPERNNEEVKGDEVGEHVLYCTRRKLLIVTPFPCSCRTPNLSLPPSRERATLAHALSVPARGSIRVRGRRAHRRPPPPASRPCTQASSAFGTTRVIGGERGPRSSLSAVI